MSDTEIAQGTTGLELAIVGMAGRFPGARSLEELWRNLREGVESITWFSDEELLARGAHPAAIRSPSYVKAGRVLEGFDELDAAFFGISPREAELIDPQHRVFLECAWEALEDAAYDLERYAGGVGVYAGARMPGYLNNLYSNPALVESVGDFQVQVANDKDYLATRVSYKLDLGGPSVTVQTACSTALVALHMAGQGLLSGDCDMALAGGVGIRIPECGYPYVEGQIYSRDGHVRTFDARASGTMFASGVGVVVLKRLEDALADGDRVRAVIKGSAITNDGSAKVGFTAPGTDGQSRVIRAALLTAEVEPETVSFVEAHGTGTHMGDPIEVAALTKVFRERTERKGFCALGSVKTNIGHLGAAAGVAGLIKTVLAMEHRELPPSLHFEEPNPEIDFAASPFYVNAELAPWKTDGAPRRAGVSAFGVGGTNAHVIVEEAPATASEPSARDWHLLALSARTEPALEAAGTRLAAHLESHPELELGDAAYTLAVGRKAFDLRQVVVARDPADALRALRETDPERVRAGRAEARDRAVTFMFTGQGAQYPGMGRGLYEAEPVFRRELDRCCELLEPHLEGDLRELLFPEAGAEEEAARELARTRLTQPALFAVEYALARQWMAWGVEPESMIGHSIGEYVAACLAEVFSLEDALALVAARGRLMQDLPGGSMLGVPLAEEEVEELLEEGLSLATVNGPKRCAVAGPDGAIDALEARLAERGVSGRRLRTSHAFHSPMMEPILGPFVEELRGVELAAPQIPYVSNVTGTWITAEEATDPAYWARHLRRPVRFSQGLEALFEGPERCLLEVGPGKTLATLARQHPGRGGRPSLSSLRHPKQDTPDAVFLLRTLGELWLAGARVDLARPYAGERRRRVELPTYPFERQRFWIDQGDLAQALGRKPAVKKADIADWFYLPYWKPSAPPVLTAELAAEPADWLLFLDAWGLGAEIAGRLTAAGHRVVTVEEGDAFEEVGDGAFRMPPGEQEAYAALLARLAETERLPSRAVHLWNVTPGRREDLGAEALSRAQDRAFWSLFFFAQALGKQGIRDPLSLLVVSNNLHRVAGEGFLNPEKAMLLGPAKVIPQEYPNLRCGAVDVTLPENGSEDAAGELAGRLVAEAVGLPLPAPVVAWRGGDRWVRDYGAVRLEAAAPGALCFREGGTYLITGGLGGLGLTFAGLLAGDYRAKLVLLGISALPPREEWDGWLAGHPPNDRLSRRILKVRELEALGAEVQVAAADVTDEEAMGRVVAAAVERFGEIHGAIHAAGLAGKGMMQLKAAETAAGVLAPKVQGTAVLERVLADQPLDFLVLCSSTIAVVGGFGQVDYCAANSFLDALAQARALRPGGPHTVAVNWGAWEEVGMAVDSGLMPGRESGGEEPAEPIHPLLDRCLSETAEQTTYSTRFATERHWVAAEHRILGNPTVPGATYLEMARAAFEHHAAAFEDHAGLTGVEVRDVLFLTPLMIAEGGEKEARTVLTKDKGGFGFRVSSRAPASSSGKETWQAHVRGKVGPLAAGGDPQPRDLAAIRERCPERHEIEGEIMTGGEGVVQWGAHWQCLKEVHLGDGEALAVLELPEEYAGETTGFGLHPALLDVATGIIGFMEEDNYLPLSYRALRFRKALGPRVLSHLRRQEGGGGKETVSVDVTLLSEDGEELASIERFSLKKVGEAVESLGRSAQETSGAAAGAVGSGAAAAGAGEPAAGAGGPAAGTDLDAAGGGIRPEEGVEALRRVLTEGRRLPQVVATAKDLHALIEQIESLTRSGLEERSESAGVRRATHARPSLSTEYEAPRNDVERKLAEIWGASIGIEEVGIHDNFFDLGGDSVMGIQLIAQAHDAGLELSPEQLFEHQTIAELAALLGPVEMLEGAEVEVGPAPLTPFQRRLLEGPAEAVPVYSGWLELAPGATPDPEGLAAAMTAVLHRHGALGLRLTADGAWEPPPGDPAFAGVLQVDLSGEGEEDLERALSGAASELGASLEPEDGRLAGLAAVDRGPERPGVLVLVLHGLGADAASWPLVARDLEAACGAVARGEAVDLGAGGDPFPAWARIVAEAGAGEDPADAFAFWLDGPRSPGVRLVSGEPGDGWETAEAVLPVAAARALLEELPETLRARPPELLLAALVRAVAEGGGEPLWVEVEADGRQAARGLDLAGTAGCFTCTYPVALQPGEAGDPAEDLRAVKERLRAVPGDGLAWGRLMSAGGEAAAGLAELPEPELRFAFREAGTAPQGRAGLRPLVAEARVEVEGLRLVWAYRRGALAGDKARELVEAWSDALSALAEHGATAAGSLAPSDFPEADLAQDDLDEVMAQLEGS